jgi:Kef-type K+ transport system membrane component KefB
MSAADRRRVVRMGARAGVVAMTIAVAYFVISLILIMGLHFPRVQTLVVGGGITWAAAVSTSIAYGISARKSRQR